MSDNTERRWGSSHNMSPVDGIVVRRGIPIADSERLDELGDELRQRIGRMGIPEREELLEHMQRDFPDPVLDAEQRGPGVPYSLRDEKLAAAIARIRNPRTRVSFRGGNIVPGKVRRAR
jgi:hypothetical protein